MSGGLFNSPDRIHLLPPPMDAHIYLNQSVGQGLLLSFRLTALFISYLTFRRDEQIKLTFAFFLSFFLSCFDFFFFFFDYFFIFWLFFLLHCDGFR